MGLTKNLQLLFCASCILMLEITPTLGWRSSSLIPLSDLYGKPCANGTVPEGSKVVNCEREKTSLVCSATGKCDCAPSDHQSFYDTELKTCLLVPDASDNFRCQSDYQCHISSMGRWSRCNMDTGTCACYTDDTSATVHLEENTCFVVRSIPSSDQMPSCQSDSECWRSNLGNLTRCNKYNWECECYDSVSNGKNEVGYYDRECVLKRKLGDFCTSHAECKVLHPGALCEEHHSYLQRETLCQCKGSLVECDTIGGGLGNKKMQDYWLLGFTTIVMGALAKWM